MNLRLKRLYNEYNEISEVFNNNQNIIIKDVFGNPPEKYLIEYRLQGLEQINNEVHKRGVHLAEINLPSEYPSAEPMCRMTTSIFHPNIDSNKICIADYWAAGESLIDVIIRIGKIISYQNYNIKSPLNGEAARWAEQNMIRFPIDTVDLDIQKQQVTHKVETGEKSIIPDKKVKDNLKEKICANCGAQGPNIEFKKCKNGHIICKDCVVECKECGKSLCIICSQERCSICGKILCEKCKIECPVCGKIVCKEHHGECCICQCGAKGKDIHFQKCSYGHIACPDCLLECKSCGKILCVQCDIHKCPTCGEIFCKDCHKTCTADSNVKENINKPVNQEIQSLDNVQNVKPRDISNVSTEQKLKAVSKTFCPYCKKEILDKSAVFCVMCGNKLSI